MIEGICVFLIVFIVGYFIFGKRKTNPYIRTHQRKWQNEKHYEDYIYWLDRNGGGTPIKKITDEHEKKLDKYISQHLNK